MAAEAPPSHPTLAPAGSNPASPPRSPASYWVLPPARLASSRPSRVVSRGGEARRQHHPRRRGGGRPLAAGRGEGAPVPHRDRGPSRRPRPLTETPAPSGTLHCSRDPPAPAEPPRACCCGCRRWHTGPRPWTTPPPPPPRSPVKAGGGGVGEDSPTAAVRLPRADPSPARGPGVYQGLEHNGPAAAGAGPLGAEARNGEQKPDRQSEGLEGGDWGCGVGQGGEPGDLLRGLWCLQWSPAAARRAKVKIIPDDYGGSVTAPALRGQESEPSHKSQAAEPPLNPFEMPHHRGLLETSSLQRGEEQPFPNKRSNPSCPTVPSSTPPTAIHLRN